LSTLERTQDSRERWLLWLLTAAALGLRLWGIAFGLPHLEARPDESKIIEVATTRLVAITTNASITMNVAGTSVTPK
jgi:ABC-type branched-subunit amino acid transport system permease subunit